MRLGILSAAAIAPPALIDPAKVVDGVEITAIAARDPERAKAFAVEHGIPNVVTSYEALCTSDFVDAIYIATPAALHLRWTLAALAGGKHVLCEKPLAANADEARVMVDAGHAAGLVMMEAFHWRYHPMAQRIREICDTELGTLERAEASFDVGHIPPTDIRYDLSLGGGALMDLGVYPLQWVRWVAQTEPTVVSAEAVLGPPEVDLSIDAELTFPTGLSARIRSSMVPGVPFAAKLTVNGSAGTLVVKNPLNPAMGNTIEVTTASGTRREEAPRIPTYTYQLRAFLAAVEEGAPYPTGGADSIATMQAVDAIYQAAGLSPRPSLIW